MQIPPSPVTFDSSVDYPETTPSITTKPHLESRGSRPGDIRSSRLRLDVGTDL